VGTGGRIVPKYNQLHTVRMKKKLKEILQQLINGPITKTT
jgi:hypothetical protein